jgi:DNA-binding MarR family transcriptional regulator
MGVCCEAKPMTDTSKQSITKRRPGKQESDIAKAGSAAARAPALAKSSLDKMVYERPGYLISRLHQMAVSVFLEEMAAFDITPKQYGTLAVVGTFPGIEQAGVANRIGNDKATVGGIIDRLVARELMSRQTDPDDRRLKKLYLTPKGVSLLDEAHPTMRKAQERMLEPFSGEERDTFIQMMKRLVAHHNESSRVPMTQDAFNETGGGKKSGK